MDTACYVVNANATSPRRFGKGQHYVRVYAPVSVEENTARRIAHVSRSPGVGGSLSRGKRTMSKDNLNDSLKFQ